MDAATFSPIQNGTSNGQLINNNHPITSQANYQNFHPSSAFQQVTNAITSPLNRNGFTNIPASRPIYSGNSLLSTHLCLSLLYICTDFWLCKA